MASKLVMLSSQSYSLINFRYHLIKAFLDAGISVETLAPPDAYFSTAEHKLKEIGATLAPIMLENTSLNPIKDFGIFIRLGQYLLKSKPDIAFFYTIKPVIYGCLTAKFFKIPKIYAMVSGLGYVFLGGSYKRRLLRFFVKKMYKLALSRVDKVFFHNKDDADLFLNLKIVKPQQIVITGGSGVDISHFLPLPYPQKITFLFVGRLIRDKGINEFLEAAKSIKQKYPDVRFLVAGALHANPSSLSKLSLDEVIKSNVIDYLGELEDVREALQQASVFVLPSYREGLSRAALEALATARPIITTEAPGCREVVDKNGFLVSVGNVEELIAAMEHFIKYPEDISLMGNISRKLAESHFSVLKVNQTILESIL